MHIRDGDEEGGPDSIKLFHFINGMIIVGFASKFTKNSALVVSPALLTVEMSPEGEIIGYEFDPYLSPLLPFNPLDQQISINMTACVSCTTPNEHVIRNYSGYMHLHMEEAEANANGSTALDKPLNDDSEDKNKKETIH